VRKETQIYTQTQIQVVGVGGAGSAVVNHMIQHGLRGVKFLAICTDRQTFSSSWAHTRLQIGRRSTFGLGARGDWQTGERAAYESMREIRDALAGSDFIILTAGMGGGTGSGAAPIVAEIAQELGILTVAMITEPFGFEGNRIRQRAQIGMQRLRNAVDALIVVKNDHLLAADAPPPGTAAALPGTAEALRMADQVLRQSAQVLTELVHNTGLINIDFADLRSVLTYGGATLLVFGHGRGPQRVQDAVADLRHSPLLDRPLDGAQGLLLNITAGPDVQLREVDETVRALQDLLQSATTFVIGTQVNPQLTDEIEITLLATGLPYREPAENIHSGQPAKAVASRPAAKTALPRPTAYAAPSGQQYRLPAFLQNR
jgi:cell division protein FtsZ